MKKPMPAAPAKNKMMESAKTRLATPRRKGC